MKKHIWMVILGGVLFLQGATADETQTDTKSQPTEELKTFLKEVQAARPQYIGGMFAKLTAEKSKNICEEISQFGAKFSELPEAKGLGAIKIAKITQHCAGLSSK